MNIAIFAYSRTGCKTARRICMALPEAETLCYAVPRLAEPGFLPLEKAVYGAAFSEMDALIFVGAAGIAVREIAPYVRDKRTDPAVLGLDERANFVIPLLSGHIGGANALARRLAAALGATAVVTTATDVNGKFSVDTWAAEHGCAISDMGGAKQISAEILEHSVPVCSDFPIQGPLPDGLVFGRVRRARHLCRLSVFCTVYAHAAPCAARAARWSRLPEGHLEGSRRGSYSNGVCEP